MVLLALPLTLALLAAVIYWLARRWQNEAFSANEEIAGFLGETRRELVGLRRVQEEYAGLHRQPYTQLAEELAEVIGAVEQDSARLEQGWQELNARRDAKTTNRLRGFLNSAPEAYSRRQLAAGLAQQREDVYERMQAAFGLAQRLEAVPAEVAGRTARAAEGIRVFESTLGGLNQAGLRGNMLIEAEDALVQLREAQARIPNQAGASGFGGPVNLDAQRQTAGDAHDLLGGIEPLLGEWLPRVQGWAQQHRRLVEAGAQLRRTAANFRDALENAPAQLILSHFQGALLKVTSAAEDLERRRAEAEIKDLRGLERETGLLERTLQETALQFDRAAAETVELDRLLLQLESDFKLLAGRMAQAETHEAYPLDWDASRVIRNDLQERIADLGGRDQKRTPEQVSQVLATGKELLARLNALLEKVNAQGARFLELAALMETPDLAGGAEWARKAVLLGREAAAFDPANWNRADEVGTLARDAAALSDMQARLVPLEKPAAIKESGLARRLEDAKALAALHQRMRPRCERLRLRLDELRRQDQDARDDLERLNSTIDQLALLFSNNTYLAETAAVELERLRGETARLGEELGRPAAGTLEKKIQRLKVTQDGLAKAASGWLDRLAANIQVHTRAIADELAALDQVAALDDREVTDARELLRRLGLAPTYPRPDTYMDAAVQLKRCAADWQLAAAGAAALDACSQPVLAAARDADQARRAAKTVFQSAAKLAGGRREWPPVRQTLEKELEEFRKLEARLDSLHGGHWPAGKLVRELGLLYHELDKIDDRAAAAAREAERERAEAQEAERVLVDLQRQWQGVAARSSDLEITAWVRDLTAGVEKRLNSLRADYRRGAIHYDQALAGLEEQADLLRGSRLTTRDGKSVGIDLL